jgi:hypothetical protein
MCAIPLQLMAAKNSGMAQNDFYPFKIKDSVYSASETVKTIDHIKYLNCLMFGESLFLRYIDLHHYDSAEIKKKIAAFFKSDEKKISPPMQDYFKKVVTIIKLKKYIESQSFKINQNLYNLVTESARMNNCGKVKVIKGKFSIWLEDLIKLEMYFKSRFKDSTFVVGGSEIEKYLKQHSVKTKAQAKLLLIEQKRKSSVQIFLQSVTKQISHEYFW